MSECLSEYLRSLDQRGQATDANPSAGGGGSAFESKRDERAVEAQALIGRLMRVARAPSVRLRS